jgi:dGTP triphosphohydrolase
LVAKSQVAALFALHNLRLEASAEPSPPKGDNSTDDDCKLMYEGAVVLYGQHLGDWNLTLALNELEDVNYKVEDLEVSFCQTIIEALQDIDVETENSQFDEKNDGGGVLADMTEILERRVEQVTTSPMMFDLARQENNEVVISPETPATAKAGTESLNSSPTDSKSSARRSSTSTVAAESPQTSQAEMPQRLHKRKENC